LGSFALVCTAAPSAFVIIANVFGAMSLFSPIAFHN